MSMECTTQGNQLSCMFTGRLDTNECNDLDKQIEAELKKDSKTEIVFNLKEVDYIASSFLRICAKTAQAVGSSNFSIIDVKPVVKKVFKISGLADKFNVK